MNDALLIDRLQFAFTISYHYLFPQLTMGLALLIVILKWIGLKNHDERYHRGHNSGHRFLQLILPSASLPEFRWNSNSEPTGHDFQNMPAE